MSTETWQDKAGRLSRLTRARWSIAAGLLLALGVLAAAIILSLLNLRQHVFGEIANRDGRTLDAVAAVQFADDRANDDSVTTLDDPGEQIQLALKISGRLRNVLGVRLFSAQGEFITAFPAYITEADLPAADLARLAQREPVSHFVERAQLKEQDLLADTNSGPIPLLVVNIPLREESQKRIAGIAQFLVHGADIAREYRQLDKHLALQGVLAFSVSGAILVGGLWLAFRRVERANLLLAERTKGLLKANQELALAAKTSAIGVVTSHLIHGLKNPLSGLRSFVQDRVQGQELSPDWTLAVATTQRMQSLIDRVVRVLQEQQTVAEYEVTCAEMLEILAAKVIPTAELAEVKYSATLQSSGTFTNHQADLILLILENLLQNAIEATPANGEVGLRVFEDSAALVMEVQDQGPGLSPEAIERLFTPCSSAKKGGSGIGLAISRQLATHLGASLELKQNSSNGCCFRLVLAELNGVPKRSPETGFPAAATPV